MSLQIEEFRMPRFREVPDVGLFLDQTVKYINRFLQPLGCMEITSSMVSNYVKKGYIANPVRKQYSAQQIARLFFIAIVKSVLSMDNIQLMLRLLDQYPIDLAYDSFCDELEAVLSHTFSRRPSLPDLPDNASRPRQMLRSTITAVAHIIYLSNCFDELASTCKASGAPLSDAP